MKHEKLEIIELDTQELEATLGRLQRVAERKDYEAVRALADAYRCLVRLLAEKDTSMHRLKKMLFGASTEKTDAVLGEDETDGDETNRADTDRTETDEPPSDEPPSDDPPAAPREMEENELVGVTEDPSEDAEDQDRAADDNGKKKGHGRNPAKAYTGGKKVRVPHELLKAGDDCPRCLDGTVYPLPSPGVLVRITGQAPLMATIYELEKLRCNLCGKVFTARAPEGIEPKKYDAASAAMIAMMKYGSGLPFNRLERLQQNLGIPLAASTQWDVVEDAAAPLVAAHEELIRQAAQGDVVHNDDTTVKILELMGKRAKKQALEEAFDDGGANDDEAPHHQDDTPRNKDGSQRKGLYTSGVVSMNDGRRIVLFFSGRQHAGENLADVLRQRAEELDPPIHMCDALSRNLPDELATIMANCLAHGRRNFVDVYDRFSDECRHVLKALKVIYKNDADARKHKLSPEGRLALHQAESRPVMNELQQWLKKQFDDHLVEPNSALGKAISYLLNHWDKLTLFLREPGAPLDNNVCEQALKKAILHRKNALFYKTQNGARVGDLYMSLIYTCEVCGANPLDYLTELQRHAADVAADPANWMPWNYREAIDAKRQAA